MVCTLEGHFFCKDQQEHCLILVVRMQCSKVREFAMIAKNLKKKKKKETRFQVESIPFVSLLGGAD